MKNNSIADLPVELTNEPPTVDQIPDYVWRWFGRCVVRAFKKYQEGEKK